MAPPNLECDRPNRLGCCGRGRAAQCSLRLCPPAGTVDVAASGDVGGSAAGGTVHLRARRYTTGLDDSTDADATANDVRMILDGTISGADSVIAEAVRVYDETGIINATTGDCEAFDSSGAITAAHISRLQSQTTDYMTLALDAETGGAARLVSELTMDADNVFLFLPASRSSAMAI